MHFLPVRDDGRTIRSVPRITQDRSYSQIMSDIPAQPTSTSIKVITLHFLPPFFPALGVLIVWEGRTHRLQTNLWLMIHTAARSTNGLNPTDAHTMRKYRYIKKFKPYQLQPRICCIGIYIVCLFSSGLHWSNTKIWIYLKCGCNIFFKWTAKRTRPV